MNTNECNDFSDLDALLNAPAPVMERRFDIEHLDKLAKDVAVAKFQQRVLGVLRERLQQMQSLRPGFTAKRIADRLGVDPSLVSRRLNGRENMSVRVIAEMFLALEADPDIGSTGFEIVPVADCPQRSHCSDQFKELVQSLRPVMAVTVAHTMLRVRASISCGEGADPVARETGKVILLQDVRERRTRRSIHDACMAMAL